MNETLSAAKRALLQQRLQGKGKPQQEIAPCGLARSALPLSFAQQRLWFLDQLEPGGSYYNIPGALRLRGQLDIVALRQTLNAIVERHETLRTSFSSQDGKPLQVVAAHLALALEVTDLSHLERSERDVCADDLFAQEAQAPFDLARGPLIRARLLRMDDDEHIILFTLHHIVADAWSMGVLVREVAALYGAFVRQLASPLAPLAIQYGDFAHWQRRWLEGERLAAQLAYWSEQLSGAPALLALPLDHPRPAVQRHRGALLPFTIGPALVADLNLLSRQAHASLFMTLAAAFNVLLARYCEQDDICIGTPIANRNRAETEPLIGFFVNTLVLRTRVDAGAAFTDLLAKVRSNALAAYAHQDLPFEQLVDVLKPQRHAGISPLFQAVLVLQNAPVGNLVLPGLQLESLQSDVVSAKFDLTLNLFESDSGISAAFEYNGDLFEAATMARMARHFTALLQAIVADPLCAVGELAMLAPAERTQLLVEFNATATGYPGARTIAELFEEQAARHPHAIACQFQDAALDYATLNGRANVLAARLRAMGVGPDVLVGVCLDRSLLVPLALLAILKAGGAYLPLDAADPRMAGMLADARPALILTGAALLPALAGHACLCLDGREDAQAADPAPSAGPDNLAYVVYTSGSSGKPKGVLVTQRNVVRLVCNSNYFTLEPGQRVLQYAPLTFDAATFEIWAALLNGATLVLQAPGRLSNEELGAAIVDQRIDTMWLTAALLHQMVEHQLPSLARVRHILAGGEALSVPHVQRLLAGAPATRLSNGYGPTEATTFTCVNGLTGQTRMATSVPLGRPIANTQVYILDANMEPVAIGVAGELYIGGDGLARGYLGQGAMSAERFLPHPFGAPGARLYRSGDLARYLADGAIEFLGRIDQQVKIRGFRIEPGEIGAALARLPQVRQAHVLARPDGPGGAMQLVAYLVPNSAGGAPEADALRAALAQSLPHYMIPAHFVTLAQLPLTANGKLDQHALPAPQRAQASPGRAPHSATEQIVGAIWAEVLGLPSVGADDDFFALGGHSLLATQVISKLRSAFALELPLRTVFEAPTLAALAGCVDLARSHPGAADGGRILPRPADAVPALSFAQQRLWFLDQFERGNAFYNMPAAVRLKGRLDLAALATTVNDIVRRHQALRTTFASIDGTPLQVIAPQLTLALDVTDLGHLPLAAREASANAMAQDEARTPFDLAAGPLIRVRLLRMAGDEHILLLTLHHIVSDGWSMGVLVKEVAALYAAHARGLPSPLPELAIQYADFAHWQRSWLSGEVLEQQVRYWRTQLAGAPTLLALPTDRRRPAQERYCGATWCFMVGAPATAALQKLAASENATLFMALVASFNVLLARYSGQSDICIGSPIANRNREETEGLIGFFVNTLVLRSEVDPDASFRALLQQVRGTALAAYSHQDVPFDYLVELLKPQRHTSHHPLFQVALALQNAPMGRLDLPELTLETVSSDSATAKFDLLLDITENDGQLFCRFEYNTDLFERATMERMAGHFTRLLDAVVAAPDSRLASLPMLAGAERGALLAWGARSGSAAAPTLDRLFAIQAEKTPDAIALVHEATTLTYGELDARANRLAHSLRSMGVGPDVLVALCAERSPDMIVGLLAILKAGGAYLPLDPAYPKERISYMLGDAQPAVLLVAPHLRASLPPHAIATCILDSADPALAAWPDSAPPHEAVGASLAYLIYTSGSTGKPKGALLSHANVTRLFDATAERFGFGPHDTWTLFHSYAFDFSVWEIWGALLHGGKLVVVPYLVTRAPEQFHALLARERVTILNQTPSAFLQLAHADAGQSTLALRHVIFGGEALNQGALAPWFARHGDQMPQLTNMYGITETTVHVTAQRLLAGDADSAGIGRALPDLGVYLLDAEFEPVPLGVAGHLHVAGAGLARGYLGRPGLTAERFVPDPFGAPGQRMYRSGDLARHRPDATLDYLGRIDDQVKIRGFRIELGEIEAALAQLPEVRESLVLVREDAPGDRRLVAYVVGQPPEHDDQLALQTEQTAHWNHTFDQIYGATPAAARDKFDISGWNSSYDRKPIAAAEMQEWVELTVACIRRLRPRKVLEVGCGTGLLLHRLAPDCERYHGTDLSNVVIERLRGQIGAHDYPACDIALHQRAGADLGDLGLFDTVIINSVAQYFPNLDYLTDVLANCVDAIDGAGSVFVGDIRHLGWQRMFHTSTGLYHAAASDSIDQLRQAITRSISMETELLVDPLYFFALQKRYPRISRVEILPKLALASNEMSNYRYDVVLTIGTAGEPDCNPAWRAWPADGLAGIEHALAQQSDLVAVRDIPNAKLELDALACARLMAMPGTHSVSALRQELEASARHALDHRQLCALAEKYHYHLQLSAAASAQGLHAVFARQPLHIDWRGLYPAVPAAASLSAYANVPAQSQLQFVMRDQLRARLREQLPAHMIPAHFVVLDHLPMTANGKIDRLALPAPDMSRGERGYVEAETATERMLAAIWAEVLKLDRVGLHDDFFALGGHSLLATQVIANLRSAHQADMPLRSLFEAPTLKAWAGEVDRVAAALVQQDAAQASIKEDLLRSMDDMSEEQLLAMLAAHKAALGEVAAQDE